ncbi:MAG: radical SAM protein [Candidatus Tectomicrobia bacterium]|uniref:Radical SAM protein n=1 Tax=Tectimicrobiota bacterium TaxID=2528274 RepID=A0A932CPP8_UNCTE|nr:radical SAM protein [Candidatus Tectomicrobia bacterium]
MSQDRAFETTPSSQGLDRVLFSINPERRESLEKKLPHQIEVELTNQCAAGCIYCYAASTPEEEELLPTERCLRLIDECVELQMKSIMWAGGDPQLHPHWFEILSHSAERGIGTGICVSGMLSRRDAERIRDLERKNPNFEAVAIHIDTIDPEAYRKINNNPKTLEAKIRGYRTLLEVGFPRQKINPILCLTRPIMGTITETIDWYVDEMGAENISTCVFKPGLGFAREHVDFEPSLSEVRRFMEYLARKTGHDRLRTGPSPLGTIYCRTNFTVHSNGDVTPCALLTHLVAGNIFQEGLGEIFHQNREMLLFDCQVTGACGSCENNDICNGCRSNAFHYLGDLYASDPKCWLNPEAKEYYLQP